MTDSSVSTKELSPTEALAHIATNTVNAENYDIIAQTLYNNECWQPLLNLLKSEENKNNSQINIVESSKILFYRLSDKHKAVEKFNQLIKKNRLPFDHYYNTLVSKLINPQDYKDQLLFFEKAKNLYSGKDRVQCLQKICFIYEKKVFQDESKVFAYYTELLQLDPQNIKALKFFKNIFSQNSNWPEVEKTLLRIIAASKNKHHQAKEALELASIYVYQLSDPDSAVKILEKYWDDASVDNSTVLLAAYEALGDYKKAFKLLDKLINMEKDSVQLAKIHHKVSELSQDNADLTKAKHHLVTAINLQPHYLQYHENLALILLFEKNWLGLQKLLKNMRNHLDTNSLLSQIDMTIARIEEVSKK